MRRISAAALVTVALVFVVAHAALSDPTPNSSPNFTISSSISSSSTSQIPALLYPGIQRYLWYNIYNPQQVSITVNSLGISDVTAPPGCPISNLDFTETSFSGSLEVAPQSTSATSVPIALYETNMDQHSCEGKTFSFTYSGSATYNEVYSTATAVSSSPPSPSLEGQSVVYTATVSANAGANQDPVPSSPTGTVTFKDGSITICSDVSVSSISTTTSTATCSPFAYSASITHSITAIYSNSDGNFSGSTSPAFSQVVDP